MSPARPRPPGRQPNPASELALRIWQLTGRCGSGTFQDAALAELRRNIPFDGALWGYATVAEAVLQVHAVHLVDVSAEAIAEYQRVKDVDPVARRAIQSPGQSIGFTVARAPRGTDTRWLDFNQRWGLHSLSTVMRVQPHAKLAMFSSIYRNRTRGAFTDRERRLHETVAPHLQGAYETVLFREIERSHSLGAPDTHGAIADRLGRLHVSEAEFETLLHDEWPSWTGPELPPELRSVAAGGSAHTGERIVVAAGRDFGDLSTLWARPRTNVDRLSARELEIATLWAEGLGSKEIAVRLGLAVNTVRNRVQDAYSKLGVGDRGALQHALRVVRTRAGPARSSRSSPRGSSPAGSSPTGPAPRTATAGRSTSRPSSARCARARWMRGASAHSSRRSSPRA